MDESGQDKFKKSTKSLSFLSINSNKLPHGHSCEHEHVHPSIHPSLSRSSSQIDFLNFAEPQNSNKLKKKSFNDLLSNCEVGCDIMMMEISENMQKSDSHVYDFQNNSNTEVQIVPKNYTESEIDLCDDTKRGLFAGNILEDRTKEKCAHYFMDDPLTFKNANSELMDHQFPTLCIECDWEDEGNVQNISNQWVVDISTEFIKNINSRHIEDSVVFQKLF
ncbi:uncharacterized protein VICG_01318 [Vittaforma corneae ATCC 50505]|uniref:Uncharacterized protein n=1 Tax=Vittaforma corneae (strain ATCC 50505) TaxID=993615 RepID=L2GMH7_VITCO|nr:uncharacterized protein VICG_01318 [Vittaforma corneae ATCC 50505]ELA41685.1 hypothetical protein VICG_01318 [Vittaforma corneae ATCC 50505]